MRGIIAYIKRSIGWLCIVIVCEVIMIATMMLNEIAFAEILYGIFISLFLLLILLVFDAARNYRHYQKIKELEHSIMLSTDGMPETADLLENEYQKLLRILADEYTGLQSQAAARQKDMQEYYAMWVHQVKTPIAALRLLLQNTFTDKVSFCHQHGIDIDPHDWPSHHLPTKIITDRGSEFSSGPLENLCESYHIEIENLPAYRPDLKGVVEKLFDLVQSAYKPLLKGKGVIETDTQERGAPDYRRQGTLDLEQFTAVVLRCVLFYNAKSVQTGFTRTPAMIEANTPPLAASIWSFCETQDDCPVHEATDKKLLYTLLPRAEGKITQRGLEIFGLRFSNCTFKKRFVAAGLGGRETVQVAYAPECMDTVWLYEDGTYSAFDLVQKAYLGKSLAEIADAQQLEKVERTDWKKQELQAQLDLMSDIQAIADRSERTMPDRSNISRQIQRNRSTARKQESVSLMDLLTEQQEDDFDAR